jgi:hypothetical protein
VENIKKAKSNFCIGWKEKNKLAKKSYPINSLTYSKKNDDELPPFSSNAREYTDLLLSKFTGVKIYL